MAAKKGEEEAIKGEGGAWKEEGEGKEEKEMKKRERRREGASFISTWEALDARHVINPGKGEMDQWGESVFLLVDFKKCVFYPLFGLLNELSNELRFQFFLAVLTSFSCSSIWCGEIQDPRSFTASFHLFKICFLNNFCISQFWNPKLYTLLKYHILDFSG